MRIVSLLQTAMCALAVFSLAACEVGPDYQKPRVDLPPDWIAGHSDTKADIDEQWWLTFNDPVLTNLIAMGAANNLDLKIAEARILQARAQLSSATSSLFPTGDLKGTATREVNQFAFPGGTASNPLTSLLHTPFNNFQTGFDASWELDLFGGNRRVRESAEAQMQASEASRDDVRVSMMAEIARTYIDIRAAQSEIATNDKIVSADSKTFKIAKQRADAGEVARLDVTQAEAAQAQALSSLPQIRTQLAADEFSMDVLLGAQPGTTHDLVLVPTPIPHADKNVVVQAPASIIAQRPDIRVAERKLASATAQQGAAVAKFFPDISLNGFFGALNTSVNNLATPANQSWLASGSIIWPIFNYGTLSANLDASNAQQSEAMANYQKTIIGALSDVERSLSVYSEQANYLSALGAENDKNEHAREIALERYKAGLTSFLAVLDAERTVYASENELVRARANYSQDLVAVYKSLGGGWQSRS